MGAMPPDTQKSMRRLLRRFREVSGLPFSYVGRRRLLASCRYRLWPVSIPLASVYRRAWTPSTRVVAVIGSLGKTTTARAVSAVLGLPVEAIQGWNAGGFLAEALLRIRRGDPHAVLEVGIKNPGRMAGYGRLIRPDIVVVISIASEHHRTLGTLTEIRDEKARMLRALSSTGLAVLNGDDSHVRWMRGCVPGRVLTFGFDSANDVWASDYRLHGAEGGSFIVHTSEGEREIRTRLMGRHMVYPVLAALTVARAESMSWSGAIAAIASLEATPHRLQPKAVPQGGVLLIDDYKSTFQTIEPAMHALAGLEARRSVIVLGATFEPPGDESDAYRSQGELAAGLCDRLIFVGPEHAYRSLAQGAMTQGMPEDAITTTGTDVLAAAELLASELASGTAILLKASDVQRFERIALQLSGTHVSCDRPICLAPLDTECVACKSVSA